jgi:hypothetical protein
MVEINSRVIRIKLNDICGILKAVHCALIERGREGKVRSGLRWSGRPTWRTEVCLGGSVGTPRELESGGGNNDCLTRENEKIDSAATSFDEATLHP